MARIKNTTSVCFHEGCDRPRGNNGTLAYCQAHQARRRLGTDMDAPILDKRRGSITERVLRRLPGTFGEECVEWDGKRTESGYGVIRRGAKADGHVRVTRVVYEHFHGPMTERLIMHTCDNPPCVNPRHLVQGDDSDNMIDKMVKGRAARKLTPDDVRAIRAEPKGGAALAERFGVSYTLVKNIRRRKAWAWVD